MLSQECKTVLVLVFLVAIFQEVSLQKIYIHLILFPFQLHVWLTTASKISLSCSTVQYIRADTALTLEPRLFPIFRVFFL